MSSNLAIMQQKQPKTFVGQKVMEKLITVEKPDGSRSFTWVARTLTTRQGQTKSGRPKILNSEGVF